MVVTTKPSGVATVDSLYQRAEPDFERWEQVKDLVDEMIDLALNYRQSGHPGGSRSKVHMLLSLMLSGAMRWDLLRPWLRFADRFVLSAGHTVPLVYATLAVLNEAMRARHAADGDPAFAYPFEGRFALTWEDLLLLRRNKGLPGHAGKTPSMAWFKTRKGRGYGKYDYKSHGTPHPMNSEPFWTVRKQFMAKYGIEYEGVDQPPPKDAADVRRQARRNFEIAAGVLRGDAALVEYLSDRLREVAAEVPQRLPSFYLGGKAARVFDDERLYDFERYPDAMWAKPGDKKANRAALATWGAWINSFARKEYGRPLFIAMSADLAESTNIAGFAKGFDDVEGWGWYERDRNPRGALLPQQITEFTNAGVACGIASVNVAEDPFADFDGFYGACSTYGSFSYLKYGEMRLFSQLAQDCELRVGRVLWVAGHSGPATAEDSRTHFGIFETGVTQLFPEGHVIDLHPWEHNEVPVVLAAALRSDAHIVALHLTRPAIEIPDRAGLGMPSHFAAARGAYVMR